MIIGQFACFGIIGLVLGHMIVGWALAQQEQSIDLQFGACFRVCVTVAGALIGLVAGSFDPWPGIVIAGLGWALLAVSALDLSAMVISDGFTVPIAVSGLSIAALGGPAELGMHVTAALAGFLAIWLVGYGLHVARGVDAIGSGDAVLLAATGAWVGPDLLPMVMVVAGLVGMCTIAAMAIVGSASVQTRIPFGPAIAVTAWSAYVLELSGAF